MTTEQVTGRLAATEVLEALAEAGVPERLRQDALDALRERFRFSARVQYNCRVHDGRIVEGGYDDSPRVDVAQPLLTGRWREVPPSGRLEHLL